MIVGARRPLIAFNVNLVGANVEAAREIAQVIRERDGGFPGVRALGLELLEAGHAQVSMNVEDWEAAALHEIVAAIEREAAARGVEVAGAELVGLMPAGAAAAAAGAALHIDGFRRLPRLLELRLLDGGLSGAAAAHATSAESAVRIAAEADEEPDPEPSSPVDEAAAERPK